MATRLETRAADLSQLIEAAEPDPQRRIAIKMAEAAVAAVPLNEPELAPALADLAASRWGGDGVQAATTLADRLDDRAWDIQDQVEASAAEQAEHLEAFRRARAVSAVAFALDADPRSAALEAVYEAGAATESLDLIRSIVNEILDIEQTPDDEPEA